MTTASVRLIVLAWMFLAGAYVTPAALAQSVTSGGGQSTFELYCASCHGKSAKGDGPLASSMSRRPADLTLIAQRSGGTFDPDQVARIIDGRNPVRGHGGGEMPVWGDAFAKSVDKTPVDEKIRSLVEYLKTKQVKP